MVNILGINPFIWNAILITFVGYIAAAPGIQLAKKLWAWVRP
jgi:hypothetical protein